MTLQPQISREILHECESFFKDLYSFKMKTDSFFQKWTTTNAIPLKVFLTELECLNALKDMEPDKSPGTDGLPSEFYQFFWRDVSKPLLEALNYGFEIG